MAKNPNIAKLDYNQVPLRTFDTENDATRVIFVGGQIAISLVSSEDSITSHSGKAVLVHEASAIGISSEINVSKFSKFCAYSSIPTSQFAIEVSPVENGDVWFPAQGNNVCALRMRIKVLTTPATPSNIYLVLES